MSKHVSYSEMQAWKTCRQKWYWSYGLQLEPSDIKMPLLFGQVAHAALDTFHRGENWEKQIERALEQITVEMDARLTGLCGEEKNSIVSPMLAELADIYGAVKRVVDYETALNIRVIPEHRFEVDLLPDVKLIGYIDGIIDKGPTVSLVEYKFVKRFYQEKSWDIASQVPIYEWAMEQEGRKVEYTSIIEVLRDGPKEPEILKNGTVSRRAINTDWLTYKRAVIENGENPNNYEDMKEKLADRVFLKDTPIIRNSKSRALFVEQLKGVAREIVSEGHAIYMNDNLLTCSWCPFYELCMETGRGRDYTNLVGTLFQLRKRENRNDTTDLQN